MEYDSPQTPQSPASDEEDETIEPGSGEDEVMSGDDGEYVEEVVGRVNVETEEAGGREWRGS